MSHIIITPSRHPKRNDLPAEIFTEKGSTKKFDPDDILEDPSRLLKALGFEDFLEHEPVKHLKTGATIWEYYLLRMLPSAEVSASAYKFLLRKPENPISSTRSIKIGNPYYVWKNKYSGLTDKELARESRPFCRELLRRQKPLREQGNKAFMEKRKRAARAFFRYLLRGKLQNSYFQNIRYDDFYTQLAYLIRSRKDDQFTAAGLMICLYGGKNDMEIPAILARSVLNALKSRSTNDEGQYIYLIIHKLLMRLSKKAFFDPPLNSIYSPGKKSLVLTRFRVPVWLALLNNTYEAVQ